MIRGSTRPTLGPEGTPLPRIILRVGIAAVVIGWGNAILFHRVLWPSEPPAARARAEISNIANACDMFRIDMGHYPGGLDDLVTPPTGSIRWDGPYVEAPRLPVDPWGEPYLYSLTAGGYEIGSYGSDGLPGGDGAAADISSLGEGVGDAR